MIKCPCEECVLLAMCVSRTELKCSILLKFLNKSSAKLIYPEWPNLLDSMSKTLRGNWCVVGLDEDIYKVQKDRVAHNA